MPFQIIRNDITKVKADAIVNTANPKPCIGSGTDSAIYAAAGKEKLLAERKKIGEIAPGQAVNTEAFNLPAKYIIHTVGPAWYGGDHGERDILHSCYERSLALAAELGCASIAFPHIDEHAADRLREREYGSARLTELRRREARRLEEKEEILAFENMPMPSQEPFEEESADDVSLPMGSLPDVTGKSLEEFLGSAGETFQQRLFELIDASGMDDVTVYKKANIDRKVFSRIRCKEDYRPKKKTAVAFAIALELDMPTTVDLLSRAEIAFSPSSKFDLIVTYFISKGVYDIYKINAALFKFGQPILGE